MISWHRFYDPTTGRYIAADPIGLDGGMNLYAYVQNDPVNLIDLDGLQPGHRSARWKDCGGGCRIRIDHDAHGGGRHLHWECKRGGSGAGGENGGASHGQTLAGAPNRIKQCARDNGFEPDSAPEANNAEMCGKDCQEKLVPATVSVAGGVTVYAIWKVVKVCGCTAVACPIGGAACAITP